MRMTRLKHWMETRFFALGMGIAQHPLITLLLVGIVSALLIAPLPRLTIDTSNEGFFSPDDPALVAYDDFRDRFGKDDELMVVFRPPEVFDYTFLETLRTMQAEIGEKVPYIKKITSLVNARRTYGKEDVLVVEKLIETTPTTPEAMVELKNRVMSNPAYINNLISADGRFTAMLIEPVAVVDHTESDNLDAALDNFDDPLAFGEDAGDGLENFDESPTEPTPPKRAKVKTSNDPFAPRHYVSTGEYRQMMEAITPILSRYRSEQKLTIHVAGNPAFTDRITRAVERDNLTLIPLSMGMMVIFLALMFRRVTGVVYPLLVVTLTILSTLGTLVAMGLRLNLVTNILPIFLLVVGVADSVHILTIFYRRLGQNGGDRQEAIAHALRHSGLAVMMTSITTAAGLYSFSFADMAPVVQLGQVTPIGIGLAFFYTITLLPALISLFPVKIPPQEATSSHNPLMDRTMASISAFSCRNAKGILLVCALLLVVAITGMAQLRLSHNAMSWLAKSNPIRVDSEVIDAAMKGSVALEVVIDTGKPGGLYEPAFTRRLEEAVHHFETQSVGGVKIGKASTITTILKEVNRALNENQAAHYLLPESRNLTAQEFLLFEGSGSEDLEKMVDSQFSMVRFSMRAPFLDAVYYAPYIQKTRSYFTDHFPDSKIVVTGIATLFLETMHAILTSMVKSYTFALVVITLFMVMLIGHLRMGLLSMAPNLLPIMLVLGLMGWIGIPFDFATMLTGSIAIGLVVDDTIHFMHNFKRYFDASGNVDQAVRETLLSTGRAILITSAVLAAGFLVFLLGEIRTASNFGIIAASAVTLAMIADFFLAPALMKIFLSNEEREPS
ncbi:MAG: MMPL family transporter [Magnetococcales bacterium]|nr:MMPL family transporter [Magnetococcales bacterium]